MITPREIEKFPLTRRIEIQTEIKRNIETLGHPLWFLLSSDDGRVIYDDIMHAEAMMKGYDPESDVYNES
jgi:hypothetical protein